MNAEYQTDQHDASVLRHGGLWASFVIRLCHSSFRWPFIMQLKKAYRSDFVDTLPRIFSGQRRALIGRQRISIPVRPKQEWRRGRRERAEEERHLVDRRSWNRRRQSSGLISLHTPATLVGDRSAKKHRL